MSELQKEIISWVKTITIPILIVLLCYNFVIIHANVPTGSMMDTIPIGSRVFGNRLAYAFSDPKRFDIVVFPFPDDETKPYVKRVIGLPGESVWIIGGKVYINLPHKTVEIYGEKVYSEPNEETGQVDESHFWVRGDVYIRGEAEPLDDHFVRETPTGLDYHFDVPEGCYLMLGDNRNVSADSRLWNDPYLKREKIMGKLVFSYWPDIKFY